MQSRLSQGTIARLVLAAVLSGAGVVEAQVKIRSDGSSLEIKLPAPRETLLPSGGIEVPMMRFQNLPYIEAMINNQGPYRFVVDTGAPLLCVNASVANELKLPSPAAGIAGGAGVRLKSPGGAGLSATPCVVDSLKIGDAEFRAVQALASDSPFLNDFDGVLGLAVFQDCLLTFDYPAGKLRLTRGELPPSDGGEVLDYAVQRGKLVLPVTINQRAYEFVLDTGSSLWFKFPAAVSQNCAYLHGPVETSKARTVDREILIRTAKIDGNLQVGRHIFERPYGAVEDERDLAAIGSGALDDFVLTLDQQNKRLRLDRAREEAIVPPAFRVFGFGMRRSGDEIKIDYVIPKSPAEQVGLKEGDHVLALADKPIEEIHGNPILKELAKKDSVKVRYIPANEAQPREIEVPIMVLIP